MCMGGSSDDDSSGHTKVTVTNKNFGKNNGPGNKMALANAKANAKPPPPLLNSENRMRGTTPTQTKGAIGYNSEERMRGDALRDTRNLYKGKGKDKGGKGKDKGGKDKGGKDKDKGKGGKGGKETIIDKTKYVGISPVFNDKSPQTGVLPKGNNGTGAETFASGSNDLTSESPLKNNLTLSSRLKNASMRPSLVS